MPRQRTVEVPIHDTAPRPDTRLVWERPSARQIADAMVDQAAALARDAAAADRLADVIEACHTLMYRAAETDNTEWLRLLQWKLDESLEGFTRLTGQRVRR